MIDQKKLEEIKEYCLVNQIDYEKTLSKIIDLGFNYIKYKDFLPKPKKAENSPEQETKVDTIKVEETPKQKPFIPNNTYGE